MGSEANLMKEGFPGRASCGPDGTFPGGCSRKRALGIVKAIGRTDYAFGDHYIPPGTYNVSPNRSAILSLTSLCALEIVTDLGLFA